MLEKRSLNLELAKDKNTKNVNLLQKILLISKLNINKYKQSLLIKLIQMGRIKSQRFNHTVWEDLDQ